ncbi:hypothetical protein [Streptomyces sp. NPDC048639]|uniref:hypothetical protein n=1 Tax=Streptomyces sp. NPDC048639 TaxID=3365581 RepID=UPI00371D6F04
MTTLHQYVRDEDDAFRHPTQRVRGATLAQARPRQQRAGHHVQRARDPGAEPTSSPCRLGHAARRTLLAARRSPHAARRQVIDVSDRLCGEAVQRFMTDLYGMLTQAFQEAGASVTRRRPPTSPSPSSRARNTSPDGTDLLRPAADALVTGLTEERCPRVHRNPRRRPWSSPSSSSPKESRWMAPSMDPPARFPPTRT